uniref:Uncharacterized protein n=1 Tax=Spongospora subterranea TaxID=70186 RepID=A0A0H5QUF2_9EUKA|eukprot:CRZ05535.1 hypothetical protein [Spongospora subterranea]
MGIHIFVLLCQVRKELVVYRSFTEVDSSLELFFTRMQESYPYSPDESSWKMVAKASKIPLGPMDDYIDKWVIKSKTKQVGKTPVEENTPMASRNAPTQPPLFAPSENDYLMDNQHIDMLDLTTNSSPRQASMRASSLNQFAYKRNLVQPLSPISPPPKNCLLPTPSAKISSANYNVHPTCEDEVHGLISTTAADHSVPSLNKETQRFGINARESASSVGANAPTLQCRSCCADLWPTPRYTILNNARIEMQSVVSCLGMHSTIDLLPMEGFNSIRVVFVVESNSNKQGMIRVFFSAPLLFLRLFPINSIHAFFASSTIFELIPLSFSFTHHYFR